MFALRAHSAAATKLSTRAFSSSSPASLAKITLIGRLGKTPSLAKDKQGRDVLIYSVGTAERVTGGDSSNEPSTTWHRVLHYNTTDKARDYLSSLPAGTMVHVEADHKKRTLKDDNGNYTEQTLNLMKNIEVLAKPRGAAEEASPEAEAEAQGN